MHFDLQKVMEDDKNMIFFFEKQPVVTFWASVSVW